MESSTYYGNLDTFRLFPSKFKKRRHGTRENVLTDIHVLLHERAEKIEPIKDIIFGLVESFSATLNPLLDDCYTTDVERLFWYKWYMVDYLDNLFELVGQHFGLDDRLLILTSNPRM